MIQSANKILKSGSYRIDNFNSYPLWIALYKVIKQFWVFSSSGSI